MAQNFTTKFTYDVFLSFRGEDTRYNFTGNLNDALRRRGIETFFDDEKLKDGDELSPSLFAAIEKSRMFVIVLSENYASSRWCLDELVKILQCAEQDKQNKRRIWPIFYKVNPSDVRHQRENYGKAMIKHEERFGKESERVLNWRSSLAKIADLKGHQLTGKEYECKFFDQIVKEISRLLPKYLDVGEHVVGLEPRIEGVESLLNISSRSTGTNKIEGIMLESSQQKIQWEGTAFKKMKKLRILIVKGARFSVGLEYLPNSLRVLEWDQYPLPLLPSNFSPKKLVVLQMPYSSLKLEKPFENFKYLSVINFSRCGFITEVPDLSGALALKKLKLYGCNNLVKVHDSVGFLPKVTNLNLGHCENLTSLPRTMQMVSLERLHISWCTSLELLPDFLENMDCLYYFDARRTTIKELPYSIGNLTSLRSFYANYTAIKELPYSIGNLISYFLPTECTCFRCLPSRNFQEFLLPMVSILKGPRYSFVKFPRKFCFKGPRVFPPLPMVSTLKEPR